MCQTALSSLPLASWRAIGREQLQILVDSARNDVEIELLGAPRLLEHEQRQALGRGVGQPLVDGEAVALRLRDLLAVLVEKELVDVVLGRDAAEDLADLVVDRRVRLVVLAEHLEIDAERGPAHAEIGLPLQLHASAGDGHGDVGAVLVREGDRARLGVDLLHRHVEHAAAGRRDRKERAIRLLPLGAQGRQHDGHDFVVALDGAEQDLVEAAGLVVLRGARKLVLEAEGVEEAAQHGVVVVAEARIVAAERIGHGRQRHLQIGLEGRAVRHVLRDLAHAVHVVREAKEAGLDLAFRQHLEGVAHHGGARNLAEGADVRQARRAVAGLEQHRLVAAALGLFETGDKAARLLERPRLGIAGSSGNGGIEGECHRRRVSGFRISVLSGQINARCKLGGAMGAVNCTSGRQARVLGSQQIATARDIWRPWRRRSPRPRG